MLFAMKTGELCRVKKLIMKNSNKLEVLLTPKYSSENKAHKELLSWLVNILQPVILQKQVVARKLFLKTLINTPAIYLS
jgi:hypothetical protein